MGTKNNRSGARRRLTTNRTPPITDAVYALDGPDRYPITTTELATNALANVEEYGTDEEQEAVRNAVSERFPDLIDDVEEKPTENVTVDQLQEITFNLDVVRVRKENLEGRTYTVVPTVMITEGVHAGSNGPLYYPAKELAKTPAVWNHKPIVVYHPTDLDGSSGASACDAAIIRKQKVGIIMNTRYVPGRKGQPGKLRAEAWLEEGRMEKVDRRVAEAVKNKKTMEVSTGLFTDNAQSDGMWGNKPYVAIARNYRPDHLAVLPDQIGACSIKDGGGLMRNAAGMSHDDVRGQLNGLLRKKILPTDPTKPTNEYVSSPYVRDVFDNFCVYGHNGKMFHHGYEAGDGGIKLKGSPSEVTSKQVYRKTDGTVLNTGETTMLTADEIIEELVSNASTAFDESDREYLETLPVPKLRAMATNAKINLKTGKDTIDGGDDDNGDQLEDAEDQIKPKKLKSKTGATANKKMMDDDGEAEDDAMPPKKKRTVANSAMTVEDLKNEFGLGGIDTEQFREVVINSVRWANTAKRNLIKQITANTNCTFTDKQLGAMPMDQVQAIAKLAGVGAKRQPVANYGGLADVFDGSASSDEETTENAGDDETLDIPILNFKRDANASRGRRHAAAAMVDDE